LNVEQSLEYAVDDVLKGKVEEGLMRSREERSKWLKNSNLKVGEASGRYSQ
jgi:hypothetical protein